MGCFRWQSESTMMVTVEGEAQPIREHLSHSFGGWVSIYYIQGSRQVEEGPRQMLPCHCKRIGDPPNIHKTVAGAGGKAREHLLHWWAEGRAGKQVGSRVGTQLQLGRRAASSLLLGPDTKDTPRRGARFLGHKIKVDVQRKQKDIWYKKLLKQHSPPSQ